MSFRPQFVFPCPSGYHDEQFHYSFSSANVAALNGSIPTLQSVNDIPLLLQPDTQFHWRGFKVSSDSGGSSLSIQFKDPYGNYLSDGFVPVDAYGVGSGLGNYMGTEPPVVEGEIVCPPGGVVWAYLNNPTTGTVTIDIVITLFGVKRVKDLRCAA